MGFTGLVDQRFASGRSGVGNLDTAFLRRIEGWAGRRGQDIFLIDDMAAQIETCQNIGWSGSHVAPETRAGLPKRSKL